MHWLLLLMFCLGVGVLWVTRNDPPSDSPEPLHFELLEPR